ncbi:MAG: tol-pal system protein YbgF [Nitrospiraceae bacterium]
MTMPNTVWLRLTLCGTGSVLFLALGGCLAQQADLKQTDVQLKKQIREARAEIDRMVNETRARLGEDITQLRERELAAVRNDLEKRAHDTDSLKHGQDDLLARLDGTKRELREQSNLVAGARTELKAEQDRFRTEIKLEQERLRADQERFRNDFRDAVTKDLSKLSGDSTAQVAKLGVRADELSARLSTTESIFKKVNDRLEEQNRDMKGAEQRSAVLTQRLEAQDKALGDVRQALGDFKQVLGTLGDKIVAQDRATSEVSGTVSNTNASLGKRVELITGELKNVTQHMNESNKTTAQHLDEVNRSLASLAKALETAGDKFAARIEAQDQRLENMTKQVTWLQDAAKTLDTGGGKTVAQVESQEHRIEQMGKQIEWLQEVIKQREGRSAPVSTPAPSVAPAEQRQPVATLSRPPDATPSFSGPSARDTVRERYEQLLARMREGDLDKAQEGFIAFLSEHPNSELAPNARFWLGEAYYGKKDYRRAIDSYERVERDHPSSEKVPAALLKKGYAYLALRETQQASTVFQQVVSRYPKTQEAGKANDKLAQLKRER